MWLRIGLAIACIGALGCRSARPAAESHRGETLRLDAASEDAITAIVALRPSDCLSCSLFGAYVALRALQRTVREAPVPTVVVLAITDHPRDTLVVRQTLTRERLDARIEVVARREAARTYDPDALPAVYLTSQGRVIRTWVPTRGGRRATIGRDAIRDAARDLQVRLATHN